MKSRINWLLVTATLTLALGASSCFIDVDGDDLEDGTKQPGEECGETPDCTPGSVCWNDICVQEGVLRFSLTWDDNTDIDLHLITPSGSEIYYGNRTADGGELDVDDCVGGGCTNPDGAHVENVFFNDSALDGTYTFWVNNFDADMTVGYTLEVFEGEDLVDSYSGTVSPETTNSEQYTYVY